jgi:hypothetical protein
MVSIDGLAWTYCSHRLMACVNRPKMLLQNIHNHGCTWLYGALNKTTLQILTPVSTTNPILKIIKNWNINENVTLGKLNYRRTYFYRQLCTLLYITFQKAEETNHFQYTIHFIIRTTYVEFQTSTTIIPHGNLTSNCEIKQHYLLLLFSP